MAGPAWDAALAVVDCCVMSRNRCIRPAQKIGHDAPTRTNSRRVSAVLDDSVLSALRPLYAGGRRCLNPFALGEKG
jgi:hypothetical protein